MNELSFDEFFWKATGHKPPYDYQCRLAGQGRGGVCESRLINIPTGLGKTAAVVLAWLWNRTQIRNQKCLGRLTQAQQTEHHA